MATRSHATRTRGRGKAAIAEPSRYWSHHVMQTSDALDLEAGVFKLRSPRGVAESLKRSAEQSNRRKAEPFRSAMSMLNFYINRAGKNLSGEQRQVLQRAKDELRRLYGRPLRGTSGHGSRARPHR